MPNRRLQLNNRIGSGNRLILIVHEAVSFGASDDRG